MASEIIIKNHKIRKNIVKFYKNFETFNDENREFLSSTINYFEESLESVNTKLTSGSITPQEKVSCIAIRIMLENILDSFHSIETKEGEGLLSKTVKWMETETAFNNDIKTGFIKNLKHKNIREFFNDAEEVFEKIIKGKLSETPVKVYTVLVTAVYTCV